MTWLALVTFVPCVKSDTEVVSDYRSVNYEDLLPSLEQFFDDGVEHFDELLFDQKKKFNAKIMADGSLKHKGNEGSIHRVAAKIMGTESYNGWTYWYCNIKGNSVSIDNLRQRLISKNT